MTDREEDREAFLVRWSRRKREAAAAPPAPSGEEPAAAAAASAAQSEPSTQPPASPPPSHVESELPPIESIDAGTDVRGFLKEGVPHELAREALRRAWRSDPAIRDFVGLSENAWDFTAPEGVPGFGPFAREAAPRLLAKIFGEPEPASSAEPSAAGAVAVDRSAESGEPEHEVVKTEEAGGKEAPPTGGVGAAEEPAPRGPDSAMQQQAAGDPPPRISDPPRK
jgi:Protein of unknown function (DUF3306)